MDICAADLDTVYLDDPYLDTYPGFAIAQGEPLRDDFNIFAMNGLSSAPGAADGMFAAFPTAVLRYQVLRKADFDMDTFDPYEHLAELRRACRLLNASNPDLDAFIRRGGKAILYHGTYDQLISVRSTIQYYDVLQKRYGSFLHQSLRCYVIPGAGHSLGVVDVGADMLKMLDNWVVWNDGPNELRAIDRRTNNPLHSIEL
jgi:feruloyl esterase